MNEAGQDRKSFLFGIHFEMEDGFFLTDPLAQQEILFDIHGKGNAPQLPDKVPPHHFEAFPEAYPVYQERFQTVMNGLKRGDSFLTNLTISTPVSTSLSLGDIFRYAHARYRLCLPGKFVCFSPECFVQMKAGRIITFPMKGTIDASSRPSRLLKIKRPSR